MRKMKCPMAIMLLGARMGQMYTELDYNVMLPVPEQALGLECIHSVRQEEGIQVSPLIREPAVFLCSLLKLVYLKDDRR